MQLKEKIKLQTMRSTNAHMSSTMSATRNYDAPSKDSHSRHTELANLGGKFREQIYMIGDKADHFGLGHVS